MKLIVQIPCYNEEETLHLVVNSIPKNIEGINSVEILVIDDGSSDATIAEAKRLGVDHIIRHKRNKGLAASFSDGINKALELGADIIVNTDGDNQYPQESIPELIQPIAKGTHEIVVADRQTNKIKHFSPFKKLMQRFGSWVVNKAAGTDIPDAASGFRAYSRDAAMQLLVVTEFSYCMETIIYAGRKKLAITHVPITTNPKTRESRLFKNIWQHMFRSGSAIVRSYAMHRSFSVFMKIGVAFLVVGSLPFIRFMYLALAEGALISGHVQSLIAGTALVIVAVLFVVLGVLAELTAINRKILEEQLYIARQKKYKKLQR